MSPSGSSTKFSIPGGIESSERNKSTSSKRGSFDESELSFSTRESLTFEDVLSSLNLREFKKRTNEKDDGDGLYVRGRSDHRGNQGCGSSRSKLKGKGTYKLKFYICYSEDHLKKYCPKRNKKKSTGFFKKNAGQGSGIHYEGYDNGELLMAVSKERFLEWIMDSGGSFHMTPKRDFLFDFKEFNGGTVLLGDNRACAIMGIRKHVDKFLHVTQSIKVNGVTDDALRLYLFPHSLTYYATAWFDRLPRNSINTFEQMAKMFLGKYFPPSMVTKLRNDITNFHQRPDESLFEAWESYKLSINHCPNHNMLPVTQIDTFYNGLTLRHRDTINATAGGTFMKRRPEECYDLIQNMTAHQNDWDTSVQRSESSSSITSSSDPEIIALKVKMEKINKNLIKVLQINQQVKVVTPSCETCGGPHAYNDCPATVGQTQNVYAAGAYNQGDRSISRPVGVAIDVFVKVGTFHFPADFVVVDFDADPRVSLILERSFLKTGRALIDVYEGELTLRIGKEAITFNLDQTSRYSANYDAMSVNRIDLIDVACEEYSQEVLRFLVSGNLTPSTKPIVFNSSPTPTPFEDCDFLLEETDALLAIDDEPISSKIDGSYYDSEGDILLLEEFLNDDPSSPRLLPQ
nr:reverse transcriptase domain-containing protein [Tanacetum cinerariifolium]